MCITVRLLFIGFSSAAFPKDDVGGRYYHYTAIITEASYWTHALQMVASESSIAAGFLNCCAVNGVIEDRNDLRAWARDNKD